MSTEELRKRMDRHGLITDDFTGRADMVKALMKAGEGDEEQPEDAEEGDAADSDTAEVSRSGSESQEAGNRLPSKTERCWFKVMAGSRPDEKGPVFAAVNGESILVQRNAWVQLPEKFLTVFKDAISSEVIIADDGKSSRVRDVPRFNFDVRSLSEGKPKDSNLPRGF